MSRADELYRATCLDILENGFYDTDLQVRPHWPDGTPAHTVKKFGVVNRYNLAEDFPIMTLRRTYWKSAVDELLWIWQKKSNRICDLGSHVWDEWAGEDGTIGKAYGYQLGLKHHYKEGDFDQVDRVLFDLKNNPASRRIMTNIYNFDDLHEMNLYPCAYSMTLARVASLMRPLPEMAREMVVLDTPRSRAISSIVMFLFCDIKLTPL